MIMYLALISRRILDLDNRREDHTYSYATSMGKMRERCDFWKQKATELSKKVKAQSRRLKRAKAREARLKAQVERLQEENMVGRETSSELVSSICLSDDAFESEEEEAASEGGSDGLDDPWGE